MTIQKYNPNTQLVFVISDPMKKYFQENWREDHDSLLLVIKIFVQTLIMMMDLILYACFSPLKTLLHSLLPLITIHTFHHCILCENMGWSSLTVEVWKEQKWQKNNIFFLLNTTSMYSICQS